MSIKKYIAHLSKEDQSYILSKADLVKDIVEQNLETEEVDALLSTAKFVDAQNEKKQITMKLSKWTLEHIKMKARKEGIPYQTLIGSVLYKYLQNQG